MIRDRTLMARPNPVEPRAIKYDGQRGRGGDAKRSLWTLEGVTRDWGLIQLAREAKRSFDSKGVEGESSK